MTEDGRLEKLFTCFHWTVYCSMQLVQRSTDRNYGWLGVWKHRGWSGKHPSLYCCVAWALLGNNSRPSGLWHCFQKLSSDCRLVGHSPVWWLPGCDFQPCLCFCSSSYVPFSVCSSNPLNICVIDFLNSLSCA